MKARVLKWLDNVESYVTLLLFLIMSAFIGLQIVSRYVMNNPLRFPDEVARHAYVWMTFIGLSLATKTGDHIRVDVVGFFAKGRARAAIDTVVEVGTLLVLVALAVLGFQYAEFSRVNRWSSMPVLSMILVSISFPIGCTLASVRMVQILLRRFGLLKDEE